MPSGRVRAAERPINFESRISPSDGPAIVRALLGVEGISTWPHELKVVGDEESCGGGQRGHEEEFRAGAGGRTPPQTHPEAGVLERIG